MSASVETLRIVNDILLDVENVHKSRFVGTKEDTFNCDASGKKVNDDYANYEAELYNLHSDYFDEDVKLLVITYSNSYESETVKTIKFIKYQEEKVVIKNIVSEL